MSRSSHANRGRTWESLLSLIHARYNASGYALVSQLHAPFKVLHPVKGRPSLMVGHWLEQGLPDYLICCRGWTLLADAKESKSATRYPWDSLHPHQAEAMDAIRLQGTRMGGLLLLHSAHTGTAYAVWWGDVAQRYWRWHYTPPGEGARGDASISWEEVARICLWSAPSLLGGADYLPTVLEALEERLRSTGRRDRVEE